jgi:hypothetical protein
MRGTQRACIVAYTLSAHALFISTVGLPCSAAAASSSDLRLELQDKTDRLAAAAQASDVRGQQRLQREITALQKRIATSEQAFVRAEGGGATDLDQGHSVETGAKFACAVCEMAVPGVDAMMRKRKPEARIRMAAQKFCVRLNEPESESALVACLQLHLYRTYAFAVPVKTYCNASNTPQWFSSAARYWMTRLPG